MGQYYNVCVGNQDGSYIVTDRTTTDQPDEYVMAKLMEFSWLETPTSLSILTILSKSPHRILVVGDYASDDDWWANLTDPHPTFDEVWRGDTTTLPAPDYALDLNGKYIVNHDKRSYVDFDDYRKRSAKKYSWSNTEMTINPVILLTAIGNGLGGGDYSYHDPVNVELVGTWAWDMLEMTDKIPEGYERLDLEFYEHYKY